MPEIADGLVEISGVAREPGYRSKIAVVSKVDGVDPVGACVGPRGSRVRMVVSELRGEKIDIIPFNDEPARFVAKALSPARVREVLVEDEARQATVIVPDDQLSLAIGREGQNARLAARLTGWRDRYPLRDRVRRRGGRARLRRGRGPGPLRRRSSPTGAAARTPRSPAPATAGSRRIRRSPRSTATASPTSPRRLVARRPPRPMAEATEAPVVAAAEAAEGGSAARRRRAAAETPAEAEQGAEMGPLRRPGSRCRACRSSRPPQGPPGSPLHSSGPPRRRCTGCGRLRREGRARAARRRARGAPRAGRS